MSELKSLESKLADKRWRLENLYLIVAESGKREPMSLRKEQREFLDNRHTRNFVPKARKLGMSTIIVIDYLDSCIFPGIDDQGNPLVIEAGHIDLTQSNAFKKLDMARQAWLHGPNHPDPAIASLWKLVHDNNPLVRDSAGELRWQNGCGQLAGVSFTGTTPQLLHLSEYGPISNQQPLKAQQILTGPMNAVPVNGILDIETTMEGGQFGECYGIFKSALASAGKELTELDWKLHFFSWVHHPSYKLPGQKLHSQANIDYFDKLEETHGLKISDDRKAFYEKKKQTLGENIYSQFPTIIDECDRTIVPGQIFPEMKNVRAQGRVCAFNPEKGLPMFTAWDLGSSDNSAAWLVQPAGKHHNFLAWSCGEGLGAAGVAEVIREWERKYGVMAGHLVPHDAEITDKGSGKTYIAQLVEAGIPRNLITVVPRIVDKWVGIDESRKVLNNAYFHSVCDIPIELESGGQLPSGVQRLEGYRKKLDKSTGIIRDVVVKDICDHISDALRTYAEALSRDLVVANVESNDYRGKATVVSGFRG